MREIRKSQDEIKDPREDINEFKVSLELTGSELHGEMKKHQEKYMGNKTSVDEIYNFQVDSDFVYNKLIDVEGRSRRNNL